MLQARGRNLRDASLGPGQTYAWGSRTAFHGIVGMAEMKLTLLIIGGLSGTNPVPSQPERSRVQGLFSRRGRVFHTP